MSPEWFQNEMAQNMLEAGEVSFPFVLVENEIACAGNKINISKINKKVMSIFNK